MEFQWDDGNTKHAIHDYPERNNTIAEVESLLNDPHFIAIADRIDRFGEQQYHGVGKGNEGLEKYVVFVVRNNQIRPISCRRASQKERQIYYDNSKQP
jgi:uncharacterized protein